MVNRKDMNVWKAYDILYAKVHMCWARVNCTQKTLPQDHDDSETQRLKTGLKRDPTKRMDLQEEERRTHMITQNKMPTQT